MLVTSFAAPAFATNCWFIALGRGQECILVDPGMPDVSDLVEMALQEFDLKPVATLITHGHLDHTFSIIPICDGYGIPAYIHSEDRELLINPAKAISPAFAESLAGLTFSEPADLRELRNGDVLEIVGLTITAIHAPGHTRGSLLFSVHESGASSPKEEEVLISGDVLFAGSIGRTDLPSGSAADMENTLKKKIWPLPDSMRVLPGHGPETTIGRERLNNPYLKNIGRN
ncbi:MAG: MBL fold metallo-hydrolase [Actinobacteria bacterium]|nr:MBL fold metallo-hydrolase [Actinomycetota bacterium]